MNRNSFLWISTVHFLGNYACWILGVLLIIAVACLILERKRGERRLKQIVEDRASQLANKTGEVEKLSNIKLVCLQAVAHDLRTSTMGMLMILNTLKQSTDEKIYLSRAILERMIESSDRTLTLINSVSEGLDSDSREIILQCQPISFSNLLETAINKYKKQLHINNIHLDHSITGNLPKIYADSAQLQKVLEQLLLNAIKHNPPGVKIELKATLEDRRMRITITDNGIGMTPKQCNSLFHLYLRNLHNPRLTGIGLGSYLCRQIIQAHGGEIGVNSQPEVGTTVWFTLPLAASEVCLNLSSIQVN